MDFKKAIIIGTMLIGIAGIGYAFYSYIKKQIQQAMSFCYKFSAINFLKLDKSEFIILLTIKIRNQSDIRLNLDSYSFDVFINGKYVTNIVSPSSIDLLANAVSEFPVKIIFNPSKLFNLADVVSLISTALTDKKNFLIKLKGNISASVSFIRVKNLPIDMQMSLEEILAPADPNKPNDKLDCKIV